MTKTQSRWLSSLDERPGLGDKARLLAKRRKLVHRALRQENRAKRAVIRSARP